MHQRAWLRKRKIKEGSWMWLKFGRVCVEGKKELWDRKGKRRLRMSRDRARESNFIVLRFPKGQ